MSRENNGRRAVIVIGDVVVDVSKQNRFNRHVLLGVLISNPEISSQMVALLIAYSWRNIRKLRNVLEHSLLIARKDPVEMKHFSGLEFFMGNAIDTYCHGR